MWPEGINNYLNTQAIQHVEKHLSADNYGGHLKTTSEYTWPEIILTVFTVGIYALNKKYEQKAAAEFAVNLVKAYQEADGNSAFEFTFGGPNGLNAFVSESTQDGKSIGSVKIGQCTIYLPCNVEDLVKKLLTEMKEESTLYENLLDNTAEFQALIKNSTVSDAASLNAERTSFNGSPLGNNLSENDNAPEGTETALIFTPKNFSAEPQINNESNNAGELSEDVSSEPTYTFYKFGDEYQWGRQNAIDACKELYARLDQEKILADKQIALSPNPTNQEDSPKSNHESVKSLTLSDSKKSKKTFDSKSSIQETKNQLDPNQNNKKDSNLSPLQQRLIDHKNRIRKDFNSNW